MSVIVHSVHNSIVPHIWTLELCSVTLSAARTHETPGSRGVGPGEHLKPRDFTTHCNLMLFVLM